VGPVVTVGDLLSALRQAETGNLQTFEDYCQKFRLIAAAVAGVVGDERRFDSRKGRLAWVGKVEAVSLAAISPEKVRAWKKTFLARAGSNRAKERSARITVNSILRRAGSLFSLRRLRAAGLKISSPFEDVGFEPCHPTRYRSGFDIAKLTAAAQSELGPEEFKAYLLGAMAGLRRDEIDKLEWSWFRWEEGVLRLELTEHFVGKTTESVADIDLDPEVVAIFRGFHAQAGDGFVIESKVRPRRNTTYRHYRAQLVFDHLCAWLRRNGVSSRNPLHALRKEFGSQIADKLGIFAASAALRHSDIKVTAAHYLERKRRISAGLGALLKHAQNVTALTPADKDTPISQRESAHG
jgi:integrase